MNNHVHDDQPVLEINARELPAEKAVLLLHGRGSSAQAMAPLAKELQTGSVKFFIPQAAKNRWYPQTAFGPLQANQPDLSSALSWLDELIENAVREGFEKDKIILGGFSQGACLAAEYVARSPQRYGGLFILSGALIGPPQKPRRIEGSLEDMPVFIGGSDLDPWVEHPLMETAARVFEQAGARVDFRTYPGMGHTINEDELSAVREMIANV